MYQSYLTSGNCTCQAATGARAGKALDFIWRSGGNSYTWNGPVNYCNPYNCTNTKCFSNGCAQARAGFCGRYGKLCPNGCLPGVSCTRKCYGPQGQDPCPATCNKTITDATDAVIDYLLKNCPYGQYGNCSRTTVLNPDCVNVIKWMRGHLTSGYTSGLNGIITLMCKGGTINGRNLASHTAFVANAFRCAYIQDKAFGSCRSGCAGGTCGGKKCESGTHLNASTCNCDKDNPKDPFTDFFGSFCHFFDFLPWGGCNNQTNTMVFLGAMLLLVFVLLRRV